MDAIEQEYMNELFESLKKAGYRDFLVYCDLMYEGEFLEAAQELQRIASEELPTKREWWSDSRCLAYSAGQALKSYYWEMRENLRTRSEETLLAVLVPDDICRSIEFHYWPHTSCRQQT